MKILGYSSLATCFSVDHGSRETFSVYGVLKQHLERDLAESYFRMAGKLTTRNLKPFPCTVETSRWPGCCHLGDEFFNTSTRGQIASPISRARLKKAKDNNNAFECGEKSVKWWSCVAGIFRTR